MEPWELIEKLKEENNKLKESNFKLTAQLYKYADSIVELQKDVARKMDTNSRFREALNRIVFDEEVTWEQTQVIAKRALKLPPFDK